MSELYTLDNHKRKEAERATQDGVSVTPRKPPPRPNVTLEQSESLEALADQLEAKANGYAKRSEQSAAAERDGNLGPSDELNYGVCETLCRNVAEAIRERLAR